MVKRIMESKWKWVILLVAACLLVATVAIGLWKLWPDSPEGLPAEPPGTEGTTALVEMEVGGVTAESGIAEPTVSGAEASGMDSSIEGESTALSGTESDESATEEESTTTEVFTTTTAAPKVELSVTSHKEGITTTNESFTTFTGTSDPLYALKINGKVVERDEDGAFSLEYQLQPGKNEFVFSHKGKETTYTIKYNYVVMQSYTPSGGRRYKSGASFAVVVSARVGSIVTATFNGKTITLGRITGQGGDGEKVKSETFVDYTGTFKLPTITTADKDMGAITFKASYRGVTNIGTSGSIVCKKAETKVIGEVVAFSAETFDGDKNDDDSRPTNNYFPKGTVDYVVGHTYFGDKEYLLLRCGRRVYVDKELSPPKQTAQVTREYEGILPDTNQLSLSAIRVTSDATYITLNTNWKAPFFLDVLPQSYKNPSVQDYRVTSITTQYVEITFCYATKVTGNFAFDKNHPLFSRATVEKSSKNTVLRLYLRRQGGFYGWDAYYNSRGQLEFYFLHPAQVTASNNAYGANLKGVTIMLDVGHSYTSGGASGLDSAHPEEERNYYLATLLKRELESIGATVILNRTATGNLNQDQRCVKLKNTKPDLCIAIHHDANNSSKPNGFGSFYSLPYSYSAAKYIYNATMNTGIYDSKTPGNNNRLGWHYYFVARMSDCPVVLTENGYMSSRVDHRGIISDQTNMEKARAITKGVAQYFLSIRIAGYIEPVVTTTTPATTKATQATAPSTTVKSSVSTTAVGTTRTLPTTTVKSTTKPVVTTTPPSILPSSTTAGEVITTTTVVTTTTATTSPSTLPSSTTTGEVKTTTTVVATTSTTTTTATTKATTTSKTTTKPVTTTETTSAVETTEAPTMSTEIVESTDSTEEPTDSGTVVETNVVTQTGYTIP